ncbi:MAG TPA: hypothetical protein VIF62_29370, partial [Labilithrix sp.]
MDERFEGELVRETPNAVTSGIRYAWLALTFALLPAYGFPLLPESVLALGGAAWFPLSFVMVAVMRRFAKRPKRARVRAAIDSAGVQVDAHIVARRTQLISGAATTDANGVTRVVLQRRRTLGSFFGVAPLIVFLAS